MFLKLETYHLSPNTKSTIKLFNGTFDKSDNLITRDRMIDVSLVGDGTRAGVDSSSWSDINKTSVLNFTTGDEGTWVAGVSTKARNIEMDAEAFNGYLEHDGVLDMLAFRKENDLMGEDAVEKYSKHVKTIFQVGDKRTDDWKADLGYPIEFIPLQNPYETKVGDEIQVKLLWKGEPLSGQLIYAGNEETSHSHGEDEDEDHHHHHAEQYRTDDKGIVSMKLNVGGQWYLRTILLEESEDPGLTHESNWATLTFELPVDPNSSDGMHVHANGTTHSHDPISSLEINKYFIGLMGALLLFGLWFLMRKRTSE